MKLADVTPDMRRYLAQDCYCPGEVYETNGILFQVFDADQECEPLADDPTRGIAAVVTGAPSNRKVLVIFYEPGTLRVENAQMLDATENNLRVVARIVDGTAVIGRDVIDSVQTAAEVMNDMGEALWGALSGIAVCD